jgi:DNA polymerase III delta prime subunit
MRDSNELFMKRNISKLCTLIARFLTDTETSVYAVKSRITPKTFVISFILEESILLSTTVYNNLKHLH